MPAQMQGQEVRLARSPVNQQRARIDPIVYLAEGRRRQAQAMAEAIGAASRALGWALVSAAALVRGRLLEPLAQRTERRRAIGRLAELDDRLLADIGLRRGDIELAVDGLLADPRVARRAPAPTPAVAERLRAGGRPLAAASANSNRRPAEAQDRAA